MRSHIWNEPQIIDKGFPQILRLSTQSSDDWMLKFPTNLIGQNCNRPVEKIVEVLIVVINAEWERFSGDDLPWAAEMSIQVAFDFFNCREMVIRQELLAPDYYATPAAEWGKYEKWRCEREIFLEMKFMHSLRAYKGDVEYSLEFQGTLDYVVNIPFLVLFDELRLEE